MEAAGWNAKRWLLSPNSCRMPGCAHGTATATKGNTAGRDKVWPQPCSSGETLRKAAWLGCHLPGWAVTAWGTCFRQDLGKASDMLVEVLAWAGPALHF